MPTRTANRLRHVVTLHCAMCAVWVLALRPVMARARSQPSRAASTAWTLGWSDEFNGVMPAHQSTAGAGLTTWGMVRKGRNSLVLEWLTHVSFGRSERVPVVVPRRLYVFCSFVLTMRGSATSNFPPRPKIAEKTTPR